MTIREDDGHVLGEAAQQPDLVGGEQPEDKSTDPAARSTFVAQFYERFERARTREDGPHIDVVLKEAAETMERLTFEDFIYRDFADGGFKTDEDIDDEKKGKYRLADTKPVTVRDLNHALGVIGAETFMHLRNVACEIAKLRIEIHALKSNRKRKSV